MPDKKRYLSEQIEMLEVAFDLLNEKYFESTLSKSVLTIQSTPRAHGHFTLKKVWRADQTEAYEINIGAETLNRPIEQVIATLVHEMVHQYCAENDIQDTSRSGTYHNKRFKQEAEKRGLLITYDRRIGFSVTQPSEELIAYVKATPPLQPIAWHRKTKSEQEEDTDEATSSTRKYQCSACGISVRATKEVYIVCGDCQKTMHQTD